MIRFVLVCLLALGCVLPTTAQGGFTRLFDGRSLAGFKTVGTPESTWKVAENTITCTGNPQGYLVTDKSYRNYHLRFDLRYTRPADLKQDSDFRGNGGLLLHIQGPPKVWPKSVEVQLQHQDVGNIFGIAGGKATGRKDATAQKRAIRPVGQWNRLEVTSVDGKLSCRLNGELVAEATDADPKEGPIGWQSEGAEFQLRNIEIQVDAPAAATGRGDAMLADYFRRETAMLADRSLAEVRTLADWNARKETYRRQLFEMLSLDPLPERTDLKPVVTGKVDHPQFTVEKLQFQSRPGLYVTGNLYVPKGLTGKAPAVLYVCGHSRVVQDGIAFGAKAGYQHHGTWFARHGFVCLTIDTLQLGEIEGLHHGTNRERMWWWNSRGYTPAGVEAWNCIRSLDYLQSRPEVDGDRIGVTGRSGGGAYSWWIAALDDRIKAAVPVAGITDLQNHVVDGAIEGHCDCMYHVNTYRWDYAQLAALVAPRPLLIANSDKDRIFPLDGIERLHAKVRRIYDLHGAGDRLGLLITEGPHQDTQDLQLPTFRWFNRHLKGADPLIESAAVKLFQPPQLKVFATLPTDQQNTRIHETFTAMAPAPRVPADAAAWQRQREGWLAQLKEKTFGGWPTDAEAGDFALEEVFSVERDGLRLSAHEFTSQPGVRLRLYALHRATDERPELAVLNALDPDGWNRFLDSLQPAFAAELKDAGPATPDPQAFADLRKMLTANPWAMVYLAPRGVGLSATNPDPRKQNHFRRRFMQLGQSLPGMQVWDLRRAVQLIRTHEAARGIPLWLQGEGEMSPVALYAALFEPEVARVDLWNLPRTHNLGGPDFLNVLRTLDVPQVVAMVAERTKVRLYQRSDDAWAYPAAVAKQLRWPEGQLQVRGVPLKP